jgi:hypothetical protein
MNVYLIYSIIHQQLHVRCNTLGVFNGEQALFLALYTTAATL